MNSPQHYDPRMGDEEILEESEHGHQPRPQKHVRIPTNVGRDADASPDELSAEKGRNHQSKPSSKPPEPWTTRLAKLLPFDLGWVPANFTWSKLKPVIRCATVCFVSAILMVIPQVYVPMGQVSPAFSTCSSAKS